MLFPCIAVQNESQAFPNYTESYYYQIPSENEMIALYSAQNEAT